MMFNEHEPNLLLTRGTTSAKQKAAGLHHTGSQSGDAATHWTSMEVHVTAASKQMDSNIDANRRKWTATWTATSMQMDANRCKQMQINVNEYE